MQDLITVECCAKVGNKAGAHQSGLATVTPLSVVALEQRNSMACNRMPLIVWPNSCAKLVRVLWPGSLLSGGWAMLAAVIAGKRSK